MSTSGRMTVVCGILREGQQMLAFQRSAKKREGGKWELPGGKVEVNESFEQALVRELKEELGVDVTLGDHLAYVDWDYSHTSIRLHCFSIESWTGEIELLDHQEMTRLDPKSWRELDWAPADVALLKNLFPADFVEFNGPKLA